MSLEEHRGAKFSVCEVRWGRYPRVAESAHSRAWLTWQCNRGLAANTLEAYGRGLERYLLFLAGRGLTIESATRLDIAAYVRDLLSPGPIASDSQRTDTHDSLANATLQQRVTVIRLFHDYLVEEGFRKRNPVRQSALGVGSLVPRFRRLPWIPNDEQWQAVLHAARREPLRNRVMLAMSYVRGRITSHRARSTIASQLFNAKEPMTLFELQEWLGHSSPEATQHYVKTTPTKLAKSYADAGYFARNLRAIEVLIDQESVRNGRAATEPWKFYDLGHGYCTYDFFDQCPHRMACAKCSFYLPKDSTKAQLLEAKTNLLRLRQEIPLGEAELSAVEDGLSAYKQLLAKLADVPTPAGPTPRQLGREHLVQLQLGEQPTRSDHW